MTPGNVVAIARRLILQLLRDRRTMALIVLVPIVIMSLIWAVFPEQRILDSVAPALLAAFPLFFVFLLTGISFVRERSQGTMERLMASPASRIDIVLGYLSGFFLFAMAQSLIILLFTLFVIKVQYQGALWQIFIFLIIVTVMALNLGIFISSFARNEFQVAQFMPLVILPQVFLCGVFRPVEQMPTYLQYIAKFLPLTYAVDGLNGIMLKGETLLGVGLELGVLVAFAVAMTVLGALALRRSAAG